MGLSEREQRVLAEMERDLFGASKVEPRLAPANSVRKLIVGVLLAVIGLSVLLFAAIAATIWIGLVGFCVTLLGVLMASASPRLTGSSPKTKNSAPRSPGTFFEDRWQKRQGE